MKTIIVVPPLGWLAKIADILMVPLMYLISGTLSETPQRGHRWNNKRLKKSDIETLDTSSMVHCNGILNSMRFRWLFLFHIPILGGWRNYIVMKPVDSKKEWHIGYITNDMVGISRIRLSGSVRMLIGNGNVSFFGIDAKTHEQILIRKIGNGKIGDNGPFAKEILL